MLARTIARNSFRVLHFVLTALLLFCAVYYAFAALDTLTMFFWSLTFPVLAIAGVAVLAFALMVIQTYRRYPAPYMLPDATGELRSWLGSIAAVDIALSLVNYLAILHG